MATKIQRIKENLDHGTEPVKSTRETGPERWGRWAKLLEDGVFSSKADLARSEGVSRAAVTQGLAQLGRCPPEHGGR